MLGEGPKAKRISVPPTGITKEYLEKNAEQSKNNMDILEHVSNNLAKAVANGMSMDIAGLIIIQSY